MHSQSLGCAGLAAAALLLLTAGPAAAKSCSNATLSGGYGILSSGNSQANSPTAGVFRLVADGNGNITGSGIQSDDGTIETETFNGTYSIAKNCTGTVNLKDQANVKADYNLVFDEKNGHFEFIRTDKPFNEAGEGEVLASETCAVPTKKVVYANRLREFGSFLVDIVGQLTLNTNGSATADETIVRNGTKQTAKMTGSYTINPDCTGTITVSQGPTTFDFFFVAVKQQLLVIDTDADNIDVGVAIPQ